MKKISLNKFHEKLKSLEKKEARELWKQITKIIQLEQIKEQK